MQENLTIYPNPFSDKVTVQFVLQEGGRYSLSLYDVKGTLLSLLKQGQADSGIRNIHEFNRSYLA